MFLLPECLIQDSFPLVFPVYFLMLLLVFPSRSFVSPGSFGMLQLCCPLPVKGLHSSWHQRICKEESGFGSKDLESRFALLVHKLRDESPPAGLPKWGCMMLRNPKHLIISGSSLMMYSSASTDAGWHSNPSTSLCLAYFGDRMMKKAFTVSISVLEWKTCWTWLDLVITDADDVGLKSSGWKLDQKHWCQGTQPVQPWHLHGANGAAEWHEVTGRLRVQVRSIFFIYVFFLHNWSVAVVLEWLW